VLRGKGGQKKKKKKTGHETTRKLKMEEVMLGGTL